MRLYVNSEKFNAIATIVRQHSDATDAIIEDFIDGGEEGWHEGDDAQQKWLDAADAQEIASWIIAGLK